MNEERVKELVKRLLQSDKVISEQQLGYNWFPPKQDLFQYSPENHNNEKQLKTVPKQQESNSVIYSDSIKKVIDLISDGFGFLVEDQVRKVVDKESKNLVRIDSIMNALGIQTKEDADKLLSYFVKTEGLEEPELVSPTDVVTALKSFVQDHQATVKEGKYHSSTKLTLSSQSASYYSNRGAEKGKTLQEKRKSILGEINSNHI
jgi:dynein regulatory complex protein 1